MLLAKSAAPAMAAPFVHGDQFKQALESHRVLPFVIRLVDRSAKSCEFQEVQIKLDPGSKSTGIGLVRTTKDDCIAVLSLFEIEHRGRQISEELTARRQMRRRRRGKLWSYQILNVDGSKRMATGGRTVGLYHPKNGSSPSANYKF